MTEILLNSETKHSQGTKSCFFTGEGTYNSDLFSSLFGIFSENSEDILSVENNFEISEETHYSINLLREHQEETSGIFSFFNENLLNKDFKTISNFKNGNNELKSNQSLFSSENSFEINFKIPGTKSNKEFIKSFSDIIEKMNNRSFVKNISYSSIEQELEKLELEKLVHKKSDLIFSNVKEISNYANFDNFYSKNLKINTNKYLNYISKKELPLSKGKQSSLFEIKNPINSFKILKQAELSKTSNIESYNNTSNVNIHHHNTNSYNQLLGSNINSNNSFHSNSGSLEYLNMLDKSWGNNLLNKIEKALKNGNQEIEIALKPRNLGKLKVSLSLNYDSAKINIITENSSAALLLAEAEQKLSQMLENTGLKLSNFNTSSEQNKKHNSNKENQDNNNKKMLAKKEISLEKGNNLVGKNNSENQILNLLA